MSEPYRLTPPPSGLTKREDFAKHIMAAMITAPTTFPESANIQDRMTYVANVAVIAADILIERLNK